MKKCFFFSSFHYYYVCMAGENKHTIDFSCEINYFLKNTRTLFWSIGTIRYRCYNSKIYILIKEFVYQTLFRRIFSCYIIGDRKSGLYENFRFILIFIFTLKCNCYNNNNLKCKRAKAEET